MAGSLGDQSVETDVQLALRYLSAPEGAAVAGTAYDKLSPMEKECVW